MTSEDTSRRSAEQERVFKKSSPNQKLILYLNSRDLVVSPEGIDKVQGVLWVDPEFVEDKKVYGQVTLTFRYGREDEEVMGLKFCNEAIMCLAQLYPPHPEVLERITPLQEALMRRLGPNAYPFTLEITPLAPPSVQLVPAKEYNGSPIGTSYDVRAYVGDMITSILQRTMSFRKLFNQPLSPTDKTEEKLHRRSTVRMGIRVIQKAYPPPSPYLYQPGCNNCGEKRKHTRRAFLFICRKRGKNAHRKDDADQRTHAAAVLGEVQLQGSSRRQSVAHNNINDQPCCSKTLLEQDRRAAEVKEEKKEESAEADRIKFTKQDNDGGECSKTSESKTEDSDRNRTARGPCCSICDFRRASLAAYIARMPAPKAVTEKYYLLRDGRIRLSTALNKPIYGHGEDIRVTVQIRNSSSRTIKQIKIFVVQHVDVCMFSNGKFKNVVAMLSAKEDCPIESGNALDKTYCLLPIKSSTKNWIALEESYNKTGSSLASTVTSVQNNPEDRNVFAIYVSYYVKIKLSVSLMGGEVSLKLPFTLMHTCTNRETNGETLPHPKKPDVRLDLKNVPTEKVEIQTELSDQQKPVIEPEKDVVEINKNINDDEDSSNTDNSKAQSSDNQILLKPNKKAEKTSKNISGTKPAPENLDEIVTIQREESVVGVCRKDSGKYVNGFTSDDDDPYEESGLSLKRAWCCLRLRRS